MKRYEKALHRLSATVQETDNPIAGLPLVELAGDHRVLIENHRGVTEYGTERICVKVKYGTLCICGCEMEVAKMTKEQLVITGRIGSVTILRRGTK